MISEELIRLVKKEFALSLDDIHGLAHWNRVLENGLKIAGESGADKLIVELFTYLHDSKRTNNGFDPGHGKRAAAFARTLRGSLINLNNEDFELLEYACEHHTSGLTLAHVTIQTCWDADRLDLGRIGIKPDPKFLCTDIAKKAETIEWAYRRSRRMPNES
jgi:uncharacterized protein